MTTHPHDTGEAKGDEAATDIIRREMTPLIVRLQDPETPTEIIAETMNRLEFLMEFARDLMDAGKAAIGERIRATGRPVEYDEWIWVATAPKETKCIAKEQTLAALLEQYPPDQVARDFLAAQPFRHGSIRAALPDQFDRLFATTVREGVKREPRKINTKFIEGTAAA